MSEKEICRECKEFRIRKGWNLDDPSLHCHHPRERCWCEGEGERRIQKHASIKSPDGYHHGMMATETPKFCPDCGKPLVRAMQAVGKDIDEEPPIK